MIVQVWSALHLRVSPNKTRWAFTVSQNLLAKMRWRDGATFTTWMFALCALPTYMAGWIETQVQEIAIMRRTLPFTDKTANYEKRSACHWIRFWVCKQVVAGKPVGVKGSLSDVGWDYISAPDVADGE